MSGPPTLDRNSWPNWYTDSGGPRTLPPNSFPPVCAVSTCQHWSKLQGELKQTLVHDYGVCD